MKLRTQLIISMVVFILALIIIAVSVIISNQQVDMLNNQEALAKNIQLQVSDLRYISIDYLLYADDQQIDAWNTKYTLISNDISNLSVDTSDQRALVNDLKYNQQQLKDVFNSVIAHNSAGNQPLNNTIDIGFAQVSWDRIGVQTQGMVFDASVLSQKLTDEGNQQKQVNYLLISTLLGAFILFLLINYFLIYRSTIKRISTLQSGTKIIGAGNLDHLIEEIKGDEFYDLAHAFNQMIAQLKFLTASKADLEKEVAERKRAEKMLLESMDRAEQRSGELDAALSSTTAGVMIYDQSGKVVRMNNAALNMIGLSASDIDMDNYNRRNEVIGHSKSDGAPLKSEDAPYYRALHGESITGEEVLFILKGREPICVSTAASPIRNGKGEITGAIAIFTDITERKRAEEALRQSEATLEAFFATSPGILNIEDNEFRYIKTDAVTPTYFGLDRQTIIGKSVRELAPEFASDYESMMKRVIDTGEPVLNVEVKSPVPARPGEITYWRASYFRVPISEGKYGIGIMGVEITDIKKAEKSLEEAKMQAEMYLDLMGHDISNMHQIAIGQLELGQDIMNSDGRLESENKEIIDTSLETLWRSARLIDNVRKLQKIRSNGAKYQEINLDEALNGSIRQYDGSYPEKSITVDYGEGSHIVIANELLQDVFTNLIGNAIKHSNGNTVDIQVKIEDVQDKGKKYNKVSIEDDGPGIPDDMKDKIFNRLLRGETKARGMGLGLYLVKSLVESYHGKVWVEDRVYGDHTNGSRFVVMLPVM